MALIFREGYRNGIVNLFDLFRSLQRRIRAIAKPTPAHTPNRSIAVFAYSEHDGV